MDSTSRSKNLVIIIPDSNTKISPFGFVNKALRRFYAHYKVSTEDNNAWLAELSDVLRDQNTDTIVFSWSGGVSPLAIRRAANNLRQTLLQKQKAYQDITLFAKSLGGVVAEKVVREEGIYIQKLIYVATPHFRFRKPLEKVPKVLNVYSSADTYQQLGNRLLYVGCGSTKIKEGTNIDIPDITHSAFNTNKLVMYKGKNVELFALYRELVNEYA